MNPVDEEFNEIMLKDMRLAISRAFIILEANMKKLMKKPLDEKQIHLIDNKANQMKAEMSAFIDSQVERIISGLGLPEEIGFQGSEPQEGKQNL